MVAFGMTQDKIEAGKTMLQVIVFIKKSIFLYD